MPDRILRLPEVKTRLGLSRSSVYAMIRRRRLPKPIALSERSVGWRESEVDAVLSAIVAGEGDDALRDLVEKLEAGRRAA